MRAFLLFQVVDYRRTFGYNVLGFIQAVPAISQRLVCTRHFRPLF